MKNCASHFFSSLVPVTTFTFERFASFDPRDAWKHRWLRWTKEKKRARLNHWTIPYIWYRNGAFILACYYLAHLHGSYVRWKCQHIHAKNLTSCSRKCPKHLVLLIPLNTPKKVLLYFIGKYAITITSCIVEQGKIDSAWTHFCCSVKCLSDESNQCFQEQDYGSKIF